MLISRRYVAGRTVDANYLDIPNLGDRSFVCVINRAARNVSARLKSVPAKIGYNQGEKWRRYFHYRSFVTL